MAFKNLFLKGYSGVDEDDYSIAVYTKQNVYDSLYYVIDQVFVFAFHPSCFFHSSCLFPLPSHSIMLNAILFVALVSFSLS